MGRKSRLKKMRKAQASDNGHAGKTTTKNKKQNGGRQRNWTDYTLIAVIIIVLVTALYFVGDLNESTVGEDDQGAEPTGVFEKLFEFAGRKPPDEKKSRDVGSRISDRLEKEREEDKMKRPVVTIEMKGGGKIKIQLEPEVAPNTVNNFISLVENGYYDGLTFHRVIPGFMIQGGCPEGTGTGGPGYSIKGEFTSNGHRNDLKHERGAVSMARSASPDSAGSQFFIVLETASHLDREYAAFGKVISGMEEVDRIVNASDGDPDENGKVRGQVQVMKKVTVETFGIAYDQPEKL